MQSRPDLLEAIQQEAHVRIDLDRYARNIAILKDIAGPACELMAVVKADAYGHGAVACGKTALRHGATHLAVARIWEALRLRQAGITAPVLVFGGPNLATIDMAVQEDLTLSIGSTAALEAVETTAARLGKQIRVHLKLDTGLHRYGFLPSLAVGAAVRMHHNPLIDLEGIYAHFSSADELDTGPTQRQIDIAHQILDQMTEAGVAFRYIHLPNSAATLTGLCGRSNLFREGIASYGLAPSPDVALPEGMLPVMSIHGTLTRVFDLPAGEGVSYGLTYHADSDQPAGTVPIGYADGLPRSLSNTGWFMVGNRKCQIRGRVCMDQTVVDVPEHQNEYTHVLIAGDGRGGEMTLDDIAAIDGTINYEIATRFSIRMPRLYIENGEAAGFDFPFTS